MKHVIILIILYCIFVTIGCGFHAISGDNLSDNIANGVVRAQAFIPVTLSKSDDGTVIAQSVTRGSSSLPVTVSVANNVQFTVSNAGFTVPASTLTDNLSFGTISITALRDNDITQCGTGGNQQCTTAVLRVYTTGGGSGIWNSVGAYGSPFYAQLGSAATQLIGYTVSSPTIMQSYTIPATKNVLHITDFSATPSYHFTSDFSNAGGGSYSTTLVLEYILQ